MKLGFICPNAPGHVNPMGALAHQLQAQNHEVVFLCSPGPSDLPSITLPQQDAISENLPEVSKMQGDQALEFIVQVVLSQTETILKNLRVMVRSAGIDALIIDGGQAYAELGALELDIPYIQVACALHFDYSGYTPLCLYGWGHEISEPALFRNREGVAKLTDMVGRHNAGVKKIAENAGLKVDWGDLASTRSPWASITQVPRAFDFVNPHWPAQFYHTGPFHDLNYREKVEFPWDQLTGQPLVYASMGTILNGRPEVFRTIVAAVAKHKDVQLMLSLGSQLTREQLGPVPDDTIVVPSAPQLEVLKKAAVCITHAGLNPVLESLAQGVPQVAIPIAFDQPGVAARIADKKTGLVTSLDKLTPDHLSDLVDEVLSNPMYRQNSRNIQAAIVEADGLRAAARWIEEALGA